MTNNAIVINTKQDYNQAVDIIREVYRAALKAAKDDLLKAMSAAQARYDAEIAPHQIEYSKRTRAAEMAFDISTDKLREAYEQSKNDQS